MQERMSLEEWNDFVEKGEYIDRSNEMPSGFLMVHQTMRGRIEVTEGVFDCIGWAPPSGAPYVVIRHVAE